MRLPVVLAVLAAVLVPAAAAAQLPVSDLRIAIFSPQRAFFESADGKAAAGRLTALQNERRTEVEAQNKALLEQEQAFERSASVLSESVRAQRLRDLERFRIDVQRLVQDAQNELMGLQRELETAFLAKLEPIVDRTCTELGLQLLLNADAGPVAWASPELDITEQILARLDRPAP